MTTPATPATDAFTFADIYAMAHALVLNEIRMRMFTGVRAVSPTSAADYTIGINGMQPEDIAQDAWLKLWVVWPTRTFASREMACAYVLQIARNLLIDQMRRQQIHRRIGYTTLSEEQWEAVEEIIADDAPQLQPELRLVRAERQRELWTLIDRVLDVRGASSPHSACSSSQRRPQRDRALLLAAMDEEPQLATAERLGISRSAVKTRLCRIRQLLSGELTHLEDLEDLDAREREEAVS